MSSALALRLLINIDFCCRHHLKKEIDLSLQEPGSAGAAQVSSFRPSTAPSFKTSELQSCFGTLEASELQNIPTSFPTAESQEERWDLQQMFGATSQLFRRPNLRWRKLQNFLNDSKHRT